MTQDSVRARSEYDAVLAAALADARLSGAWLEAREMPPGLEAALALQLGVLKDIERRGERLAGWKVGLTSGPARDMMGVGFRPFGYLLASRRLASGDVLAVRPRGGGRLEVEIGLTLRAPLRGHDLTPERCRAAVGEIYPAFEINEMRVDMAQHTVLIADGLGQWGVVIGKGIAPTASVAFGTAELVRDGDVIATSRDDYLIDDPFLSLARLAAQLDRFGRGLEAGQVVITGALLRHDIDRPGRYEGTIAGLGAVSLVVPAAAVSP